MTHELGEHFFRHEYGRLVAMISHRVGLRHLELVEDWPISIDGAAMPRSRTAIGTRRWPRRRRWPCELC